MNRLSKESSPYLKQHEENPVDWYPWGEEALAKAKAEQKPILLSIGYSACHWCHVMAHESFEDEATAALMNRDFINIKVDREERPDVDQLYQGVVQLMGRGGGWPLTVFLMPDLRPFYGGTYFPPEPKYGMPSFTQLLGALGDAWTNKRGDLEAQANEFKEGLASYAAHGLDSGSSTLTEKDVTTAAAQLEARVDRRHGGFGSRGPKFSNPMNVALMLRGHRRSADPKQRSGALFTLEKMAKGGVYDQLGGGFHRYSVDERWLVPHFEKMLYDNAQLLHLYSEAQQLDPRPLWTKTVEETVAYLAREMTSPEGAFYAAQDADSEGEEGKFFVWKPEELVAILGADDAALVSRHYNVKPGGNFEHGATVLEVVSDVEDSARLNAARAKLLVERTKRIPPQRDDKVLAGWNGLMIHGLAYASRVFARPEWAAMATKAADFILRSLWRGGSLMRSWQLGAAKHPGMIEDYGDLCLGLTARYQATFEPRFLEAAEAISRAAVEKFWDSEKQAYFAAPKGTADLLVPTYALHDNAFPAGSSALTQAQVALAALTGRAEHLDQAAKYLSRMREEMVDNPFGFGHLWLAADDFLDGAAELTVVGPQWREAVAAVNARYLPTLHLAAHDPSKPAPAVLATQLEARSAKGPWAAYLCRNFACQLPVTALDALQSSLR